MAHATVTPESYDFFAESVKDQGATPGYGNLFVAELSSFTSVATAPNTGTAEGDLLIISDDHTFPADKGFRTITLYRGDSQADGTAPGDPGFKTDLHEVKGFIAGDKAATREFVQQLKNKGVILLQQSPDCTDASIKQYGCACSPAVVKDVKKSSGSRIAGGKKGYEITFEALDLFDYQGVVTLRTF